MVGLWYYNQLGATELLIMRDFNHGRMCLKSVKTRGALHVELLGLYSIRNKCQSQGMVNPRIDFLSCLVLSCLVLSCLVLSCLVLSFVLYCLVFCLVFCLVLSCLVK